MNYENHIGCSGSLSQKGKFPGPGSQFTRLRSERERKTGACNIDAGTLLTAGISIKTTKTRLAFVKGTHKEFFITICIHLFLVGFHTHIYMYIHIIGFLRRGWGKGNSRGHLVIQLQYAFSRVRSPWRVPYRISCQSAHQTWNRALVIVL